MISRLSKLSSTTRTRFLRVIRSSSWERQFAEILLNERYGLLLLACCVQRIAPGCTGRRDRIAGISKNLRGRARVVVREAVCRESNVGLPDVIEARFECFHDRRIKVLPCPIRDDRGGFGN